MVYLTKLGDMLYKSSSSFHNELIVNSQQLLFLNILIGVLFVLYFLFGRSKGKQPPRLKMKDDPKVTDSPVSLINDPTPSFRNVRPASENPQISQTILPQTPSVVTVLEPKPREPQAESTHPDQASAERDAVVIPIRADNSNKSQKIYFAFNGHDWEAHEALGVPLNAPLTTVTKMYQHLIKTSDTSTFDFFESAYMAIIKKRKDQK